MKVFTIVISIIAFAFIVFNTTQIDFKALFEGESIVALITIVASFCVIIMMSILRVSKRIEKKVKERN